MIRTGFACIAAALALTSTVAVECASGQTGTAEPFYWEGTLGSSEAIEIKGVNGPIQAVASRDGRVRVSASRTGRRNDPNDVRLEVVEHGDGVTICAVYPPARGRTHECLPGPDGHISSGNSDVRVEFTVEVPAGTDLVATTMNGSIETEGLTGRVDALSVNGDVRVDGGAQVVARTTNGSVEIESAGNAEATTTNGRIVTSMRSLSGAGPLNFMTTNGSITVGLPADVDAEIDARTANGSISSDFPLMIEGRARRHRVTGTIGSGGREIVMRTVNGGISIETAAGLD